MNASAGSELKKVAIKLHSVSDLKHLTILERPCVYVTIIEVMLYFI